MPALPPIKPRSSAGTRNSSRGRPNSKSARVPVPLAVALTPTLTPSQAAAINAEEANQRTLIQEKEMLYYIHLAAWRNDEALIGVQLQTNETTKVLRNLSETAGSHTTSNTAVAEQLSAMKASTDVLHANLNEFIHAQTAAAHERLQHLERESVYLSRTVERLEEENALLKSENSGLTQTLAHRLTLCDIQFDDLRQKVLQHVESDQLNFAGLRTETLQHIDAAVLLYHRPQFDTAVQDLRDYVQRVEEEVNAHSERLRRVAEAIGGSGIVPEIKSMHSRLPQRLRSALRDFTKEQLLSLMDILSFEPGVTTAVASAVATSKAKETQNVF